MTKDSAFPLFIYNSHDGALAGVKGGLTKREYFAGLCLQGMLTACNGVDGNEHWTKNIVGLAIDHADSLIAELSKEKNETPNTN